MNIRPGKHRIIYTYIIKGNTLHKAACALLALLLLSTGWGCSGSRGFREVEVKSDRFHVAVHANGRLKSSASTHIGCPSIQRVWEFTISFLAPEGKEVKTGDLIVSFDAKLIRERLMVKTSELETAKKELERIRLVEQETLDSSKLQLADAEVNTQKAKNKIQDTDLFESMIDVKKMRMEHQLAELREDLCRSRVKNQELVKKTRIQLQESAVKKLQTRVDYLKKAMGMMNVRAPKAGMVVYAQDWRGNKKSVGESVWMGANVMELPDLSRMEVTAVIPEPVARKVKPGLEAEIRLDSNPEKVFKGKVKSLGRIFRTKAPDQPSIVCDATLTVLDPDPELMRPGMAAGLDIILSSKPDVLQVPEDAVMYGKNGPFVWKKTLFGKKASTVTLGARSGGKVEITGGVDENDRLLIPSGKVEGEG